MKRVILIILTIIVAFIVYVNVNAEVGEIVIPEAAIRVRVIANSNSIRDQSMIMKIMIRLLLLILGIIIFLRKIIEVFIMKRENMSL